MALEIKFEGPDLLELLDTWISEQDHNIRIETCGYYFPGNHTLVFWYERIPVEVVIALDQVRKRQGAPR